MMKMTPELIRELKRLIWDYNIDDASLADIFEGRKTTFSLDQEKLSCRLLMSTPWYTLLDYLGTEGLKEVLTDRIINKIWVKDIRERLLFARKMLYGPT